MLATDSAEPTAETPGKIPSAPPNPTRSPSTRDSIRLSRLLVGKNWGKYRIMPFRNSNTAIQISFSFSGSTYRFRRNPRITGISIVLSRLKSIRLRVSSGRRRRRLGTRARRRAR